MRGVTAGLAIACGCYAPSPRENLPCSESRGCPVDQRCDPLYDLCASAPLCRTGAFTDAFDVDPPCLVWGTHFGNGLIGSRNGRLVLTPDPTHAMGCKSHDARPFDTGGVVVEVAVTMPSDGAVVVVAEAGNYSPKLAQAEGALRFELFPQGTLVGSAPYDAARMRWWRMRPAPDGRGTIAEYGADGIAWTVLGTSDVTPPTEIDLAIEADAGSGGTAELESLGVCPPGTLAPP